MCLLTSGGGDNCICQSRLITAAALTTVTFTLSVLLNQLAPPLAQNDSCSPCVTFFFVGFKTRVHLGTVSSQFFLVQLCAGNDIEEVWQSIVFNFRNTQLRVGEVFKIFYFSLCGSPDDVVVHFLCSLCPIDNGMHPRLLSIWFISLFYHLKNFWLVYPVNVRILGLMPNLREICDFRL